MGLMSCDLSQFISTHTLTWGVTIRVIPIMLYILNFNSHAHVERDNGGQKHEHERNHFNSHAHVERDDSREQKWGHIEISTHTLTWSVTLLSSNFLVTRNISTHTLTWSVTGVY